ncbi:hypothetical protein E2562_008203 [Oryza meyeriana var. granulata]|uniref:Uncharacterized protein n=1 Tax=Oryza meyeriana var. granulata TaxID=110450 RepID=A0A6G1CEP8_9ORYZ|nr:hypothetical protein E2562_008203 [Oryza meyeriana var. granulata]
MVVGEGEAFWRWSKGREGGAGVLLWVIGWREERRGAWSMPANPMNAINGHRLNGERFREILPRIDGTGKKRLREARNGGGNGGSGDQPAWAEQQEEEDDRQATPVSGVRVWTGHRDVELG